MVLASKSRWQVIWWGGGKVTGFVDDLPGPAVVFICLDEANESYLVGTCPEVNNLLGDERSSRLRKAIANLFVDALDEVAASQRGADA